MSGEASAAIRGAARAVEIVRAALGSRVCIVTAAAGWGKTTVVRDALDGQPACWIDVPLPVDEPGALYWELSRALGMHVLEEPDRAFRDEFIARIPASAGILVVDGVHNLAGDALSLDLVAGIVESRSDVRMLLASREALPLPTATWAARGIAAIPVTEADLAVEAPDVRALLAAHGLRRDDATVATVVRITQGWAVAVRFAMMALERTAELARVEAIGRDLAFKYLAEQVVCELDDEQRSLLRDLALLGTFDEAAVAELGLADPVRALAWVQGAGIPLHRSGESLRLHDVFSAFLVAELPKEERAPRAERAARALAKRGRFADALDVLRRLAPGAVTPFLEHHGQGLLQSGRQAALASAIAGLPAAVRRENPAILMIRAALEQNAGNLSRAKMLFDRAIERTDQSAPLFVDLMRWRATLNLYESLEDAEVWLGRIMQSASEETLRELRGPVAMFLAMHGEKEKALAEMAAIVAHAERTDDGTLLRRAYTWATTVYTYCGELNEALAFGAKAVAVHERDEDLRGITIVRNTLAGAWLYLGDDRDEALREARACKAASAAWGDPANVKASESLLYQLAVERGDEETARALEGVMSDTDLSFPGVNSYRLARAIRLGWSGDFSSGVRLLEPCGSRIGDPTERRCWQAALALFYALDQDAKSAAELLEDLTPPTRNESDVSKRDRRMGDVYAGFAEIFLGRAVAGRKRFPAPVRKDEHALVEAGVALSHMGEHATPESFEPFAERLESAGQAGFARLLRAAVRAFARPRHRFGLTDAETRVLRGVALGLTPQQIADESGRSVETIRNQVKSAIRKMGVSGRLEAVAVARSSGLI